MNYTTAAIIYNPKSTGSSKKIAENFKKRLTDAFPDLPVKLTPTEYAGHAEVLAYEIAKSSPRPLIFSSSGDGGYHEMVNGAMKAQKEGRKPTTGLLPAGNANDHYTNLHTDDVIDLIAADKPKRIDLLHISYTEGKKSKHRFAHSYIGFGLSPVVGQELNKTDLNTFKESWLFLKTLLTLKPVRLKIARKVHKYDSVILSNVNRMSKYFNVAQPSRVEDGLFEVTIFRRRNKMKLFFLLIKASLAKLNEDAQVKKFKLKTIDKTLAQADGEILTIDPKSRVTVTIKKQILHCFI